MIACAQPYVPKPPPSPKTRPKRAAAIAQLFAIQKRLFDVSQDSKTSPPALAQIARAWSELEERKRILRMKPKPKDVDVSAPQRKPRAAAEFAEQPQVVRIKPKPADSEPGPASAAG